MITNGAMLTLNGPVGATIYYTLDGSDPTYVRWNCCIKCSRVFSAHPDDE